MRPEIQWLAQASLTGPAFRRLRRCYWFVCSNRHCRMCNCQAETLRIAVVQMAEGPDVAQNRDRILSWIPKAAAERARVVVFPELRCEAAKTRRPADRASAGAIREAARPMGCMSCSAAGHRRAGWGRTPTGCGSSTRRDARSSGTTSSTTTTMRRCRASSRSTACRRARSSAPIAGSAAWRSCRSSRGHRSASSCPTTSPANGCRRWSGTGMCPGLCATTSG